MTQPQVHQRPLPDFLEDLQHAYPVVPVLLSSGPDIGTDEPEPPTNDIFQPNDIY